MATWFAQNSSVNIDSVNQWNSAANGSGSWLTWASLGASDVLMWNGKTNIAINVNVTCASLRNSTFGGATRTGTATIANGVTVTADVYGSGEAENFITISGSVSCQIVGNIYGVNYSARAIIITTSGVVSIVGNLIGGSVTNQRSECMSQSAGQVVITGNITNLATGTGIPTYLLTGGVLTVTGDVTGGLGTTSPAINATGGAATITGTVTGGSSVEAITVAASTISVIGTVTGGDRPGIFAAASALTSKVLLNGTMISGSSGASPISVPCLLIGSSDLQTHTYRVNNAGVPGVARSLYTGGTNIGQPSVVDVRSGTTFGAASEYTGTLAVPSPTLVAIGVPTDNTVGSYAPAGGLDEGDLHDALDSYTNKADWKATGFATPANLPADFETVTITDGRIAAALDSSALRTALGMSAADLDDQLDNIVSVIQGSEVIQVASPNVSGNLVLTQGDDYDGTANPRASWTVSTDYTSGWTVRLTIRDADDAVVYTTTGSVVSATVVAVTIAAPTGLTMTGFPGQWQGKFDVELTHSSSKKKTIALGVCYINEDQTR